MTLRNKLLLVFVALGFAPLVGMSLYAYLSGVRTVEALLREEARARAARVAARAEGTLGRVERRLLDRAGAAATRDFVRGAAPEAAREHFASFFRDSRRFVESLTVFDAGGRPLLRASAHPSDPGGLRLQTSDFVTTDLRYDGRVLGRAGGDPLRTLIAEPYGAALTLAAPVRDGETRQALGALVAEVRLADVFAEADEGEAPGHIPAPDLPPAATAAAAPRAGEDAPARLRHPAIALDNATGAIVYHTNDALKHQPADTAMPYFRGVAAKMRAGGEGFDYYEDPGGHRWLAAYRQAHSLPISLAAADDYTEAAAPVRRAGLPGVALAVAAGGAGLALLAVIAGRATRNIGRVAAGASAIAAGHLGQRIEVRTSDEMHGLAESFNAMSDRLGELIRREAEAKQFDSFVRLSAMLTHDLKNAITGLSILVSNMERQYHREGFRADAVASLREATDKLRRIVTRLNEPVVSLSGEYRRRMRPADLVPVLRRVLAANAEPYSQLYEIEARLPDRLVAVVEPERIENVFENLVINAVEAMGARGGRLTVEAGEEDDRHVYVCVADTGLGMSEEFVRTKLFRPFATTKTKGLGLGLYTVREIVEAHGGRLDVESKVDVGTRFRVVLPSRLFSSGERR